MIDLRDTSTYHAIDNCGQDWTNRLTIYSDGDARIEEIHSSAQTSISLMEWNGEAVSISLPDEISSDDLYCLAGPVLAIADKPWQDVLTDNGDLLQRAADRARGDLHCIDYPAICQGQDQGQGQDDEDEGIDPYR